jgi:hypothetical protein
MARKKNPEELLRIGTEERRLRHVAADAIEAWWDFIHDLPDPFHGQYPRSVEEAAFMVRGKAGRH